MADAPSVSLPSDLPVGTIWPSRSEFRDLGRDHRVVPVLRRLLADTLTPVGIYRALAQGRPGTFILESATSEGSGGRYSFIGVSSRAMLTAQEGQAVWRGDVPRGLRHDGNPLEVLDHALRGLRTESIAGLPPLTSGFVGSIGWDAIRYWEPTLAPGGADELSLPDLSLALVEDLAVVDHHTGLVWLISNAINADGLPDGIDEAYARATGRVQEMTAQLARPLDGGAMTQAPDARPPRVTARTTREEYEDAVERAKVHIRDGDVFQVVLSQRFDVECRAEPIDVYRALRSLNPSPYMYCVHLQDAAGSPFAVVGSSPETLAKVTGEEIMTYPIAGSRPRGKDATQDAELSEELLADPKERSEHLMLVDLGRNDVAKVAQAGTVAVSEFMDVKRFSHIMHICSTVTGRMRPESTALDALTATFPAGTLSGAPKPRAVQLIDELEPARRGVYGGTVGYVDLAGNLDMAIAIRTAVIVGGTAHVQSGAGIVADSRPSAEFEECRNKAAAVIAAVDLAGRLVERDPEP